MSILKTARPLRLMPWRLGRSADLRLGNLVLTRGYPLGVLPAANVGRVTSTRHEDTESGWDHVDFITDAALNNGNSGSPVLAISRRTHEPELVGIFHARYRDATGMGVVVGIDEVRELLETLQPPDAAVAEGLDRAGTLRLLGQVGRPVFFPFAGLTARAMPTEGGARFEIYDDFPTTEYAQMALTSAAAGPALELPVTAATTMPAASMTDALRGPVEHLDRELWRALGATLRMRRAVSGDDGSPAAHRQIAKLRRQVTSRQAEQKEVLSTIGYQSEAIAAGLASGIQKAAGGP